MTKAIDKRERIHGEELKFLPLIVLENLEIAPSKTGDKMALGIPNRHGDFNKIHGNPDGGNGALAGLGQHVRSLFLLGGAWSGRKLYGPCGRRGVSAGWGFRRSRFTGSDLVAQVAEAIAVCGLRGRAVGQSTRRGAALGGGRVGHILFLLLRLAQEQESQHDRCKSNTHQRTPKADRK